MCTVVVTMALIAVSPELLFQLDSISYCSLLITANPALTPSEIENILGQSAVDLELRERIRIMVME